MTAQVRIRIDPSSSGLKALEQLVERATNRPGLLKNIGEALLRTTGDRFRSQTDPEGKPWAPLAPLTVELRGSATPILTRTGRLRGSVAYQVSGDVLRIGPNTVDAAAHQFGATIKAKGKGLRIPAPRRAKGGGPDAIFVQQVTIPARPYIGFGKADQEATTDTVLDWFDIAP